eukprot:scaffold347_cov380-Prasinococcus_capsulatus_cf.AAC.36
MGSAETVTVQAARMLAAGRVEPGPSTLVAGSAVGVRVVEAKACRSACSKRRRGHTWQQARECHLLVLWTTKVCAQVTKLLMLPVRRARVCYTYSARPAALLPSDPAPLWPGARRSSPRGGSPARRGGKAAWWCSWGDLGQRAMVTTEMRKAGASSPMIRGLGLPHGPGAG